MSELVKLKFKKKKRIDWKIFPILYKKVAYEISFVSLTIGDKSLPVIVKAGANG